jgi:lipoate-protein ligase A
MEQTYVDTVTLRSAAEQMALDERLALEAQPSVRLFTWNPPAISLGFKQSLPDWFDAARWHASGLELVERPTGGGIAFHGSDVSISIVVPRPSCPPISLLMRSVCESAVRLCGSYGREATSVLSVPQAERVDYCLTQPSPYAVFLSGRKVAGFALRRFPNSWLVQGSLLVRPLPTLLARALPQELRDQLAQRAIALSEIAGTWVDEVDVAQRWATQYSRSMLV